MSEAAKPDRSTIRLDEERLAHALVSRGLLTREEVEQCRPAGGPEGLLRRLVEAGYLTKGQARRSAQELPLLLGQQIPGYALLEKLGQGAMGTVFKARQLSMNRLVAVKVLAPRLASSPEYLDRHRREAHLAARLAHNNIVQAIDVGSAGKLHYFVMEYVEGRTIRAELEAGKVYGEREAVELVVQVAQALQHAHRRGLIHRDVKPANILVTPEGIAKLADLGMARETADAALARQEKGLSIGTPHYMAPEQIFGEEDIDVRADIYSLGGTLYHMVTGRVPFPGRDIDAVFEGHLSQTLTPPDHLVPTLSAGLGEVVEVMMARKREHRYRTPDDLVVDLECLLNGEPPRLARRQIPEATLAELAKGEPDEEELEEVEEEIGEPPAGAPPYLWVGVLGGLLALSALLNLVLLLRH